MLCTQTGSSPTLGQNEGASLAEINNACVGS